MEGYIEVPRAFLEMPRWWGGRDADWLAALPRSVRVHCRRWRLTLDGEALHGSNALAVPVRRGGDELMLRLAPPGDDIARQVAALRFWDGRGTVRLVDADPAAGVMLLERLGPSLWDLPVAEAVDVLGHMMRRLAVAPPPGHARCTGDIVRERSKAMEQEWLRLDKPFDEAFLGEALRSADDLAHPATDLAVNGDLHSGQVLRGRREEWLTVDPVLLRGDIEYDLGRILWTRADEMAAIGGYFEAAVRAAGLRRDRARDWAFFRTVDYWLWGLGKGLTEDPERCRRVAEALAA